MSESITRPATQQYHEGWERAFGIEANYAPGAEQARAAATEDFPPRSNSESASPAKHSPESPSPAEVEGSGSILPALFPIQVKCPACGAAPYEDCFSISSPDRCVIYVKYIHDARRKAAREERAN